MTDTLREAAEYILDGMGIDGPDYTVDPDDEYLDAANSKWVKETLSRLAAALAAAPQPDVIGRADNMPLADMARAEAFRTLARCIRDPAQPRKMGLSDLEGVLAWEERRIAALAVAPQPVAADREALVEVISKAMLGRSLGGGMVYAIADALLARGLRLPGDETSNVQNPHIALLDTQIAAQDCIIKRLEAERDALQGQLNDLRNGWANSVKAHATLLAERDAAFAAGQESMRERASEEAISSSHGGHYVACAIRAIPIKPRPDKPYQGDKEGMK